MKKKLKLPIPFALVALACSPSQVIQGMEDTTSLSDVKIPVGSQQPMKFEDYVRTVLSEKEAKQLLKNKTKRALAEGRCAKGEETRNKLISEYPEHGEYLGQAYLYKIVAIEEELGMMAHEYDSKYENDRFKGIVLTRTMRLAVSRAVLEPDEYEENGARVNVKIREQHYITDGEKMKLQQRFAISSAEMHAYYAEGRPRFQAEQERTATQRKAQERKERRRKGREGVQRQGEEAEQRQREEQEKLALLNTAIDAAIQHIKDLVDQKLTYGELLMVLDAMGDFYKANYEGSLKLTWCNVICQMNDYGGYKDFIEIVQDSQSRDQSIGQEMYDMIRVGEGIMTRDVKEKMDMYQWLSGNPHPRRDEFGKMAEIAEQRQREEREKVAFLKPSIDTTIQRIKNLKTSNLTYGELVKVLDAMDEFYNTNNEGKAKQAWCDAIVDQIYQGKDYRWYRKVINTLSTTEDIDESPRAPANRPGYIVIYENILKKDVEEKMKWYQRLSAHPHPRRDEVNKL